MVMWLAVTLAAGLPLAAHSASRGIAKTVQLTLGAAGTVDLGKPVSDVLVANPAVAEVGTLRSSRLYIVGKTVGDTNVLAFDATGNQLADIAVHVRVDEANIRETIKKFFPSENIDVKTVKNDIVLTGTVSTPSVANQVRDLAARFVTAQGQTIVDLMKVEGEQQVMLKVKIIEAQRSVLREYGLNAQINMAPGSTTISDTGFSATGGQTGQTSINPFGTGAIFIGGRNLPFVEGITAMEQNGLVNTLAEPTLTAISGETAGFLAGGEFPIPTARDTSGNVTLEFKQFGVALNFTPTVLAKDRISLQLSTEVSAKSTENGFKQADLNIPGLTTRRAETTVQIGSGGTLMIAGLLKSDDVHSLSGFPGAQDLPIIGELFKSKSFSRDESELVIMVTPYIVQPYAEPHAVKVSDARGVPAGMPQPVSPGRPQNAPATYDPLSQSFIDNLKAAYGAKAPQKPETGASFGYIVN